MSKEQECWRCQGTGKAELYEMPGGIPPLTETCRVCGGSGKLPGTTEETP